MKVIDPVPKTSDRGWYPGGKLGWAFGCAGLFFTALVVLRISWGLLLAGPAIAQPPYDAGAARDLERKIERIQAAYRKKSNLLDMLVNSKPNPVFAGTFYVKESELNSFLQQRAEASMTPEVRRLLRAMVIELREEGFLIRVRLDLLGLLSGFTAKLPWPFGLEAGIEIEGTLEWRENLGQVRLAIKSVRLGSIEVSPETLFHWIGRFIEIPPVVEALRQGLPLVGAKNLEMEENRIRIEGS